MIQYDDYDFDSDGELEAHELYTILHILKSQGIDINVYLRELILLSSVHYLWEDKTFPPRQRYNDNDAVNDTDLS